MKYMDWQEFRDKGYLQEVNRQFFHPLGLALEVVGERTGEDELIVTGLGKIWDCRNDPEGITYGYGPIQERADRIINEFETKAKYRLDTLGWVIQPCGPEGDIMTDEDMSNLDEKIRVEVFEGSAS